MIDVADCSRRNRCRRGGRGGCSDNRRRRRSRGDSQERKGEYPHQMTGVTA